MFLKTALLILRGVRYLFLLTMYFTIDINVVYALCSRHDLRDVGLSRICLCFFFLVHTPSCQKRGVIQFIRVVPK
jgi:hypothetical protein